MSGSVNNVLCYLAEEYPICKRLLDIGMFENPRAIRNPTIAVYLLLVIVPIAIFYAPLFSFFWINWTQVPLYSHGFLIPLISIFLIWREREELRSVAFHGSYVGLFLCLLFLTLGLLANALEVRVALAYSMIGLLNGIVLFICGWRFLRQLLFSINFLLFMVPIQQAIILPLSSWMKITSARGAAWLVDGLGFVVIRDGVNLFFDNNISLTIADPCSGIRSFVALVALGAVYAYVWQGSILKKIILFLAVFPLVLIGNCIRVTLLSLAAIAFGAADILDTPFHSITGLFVFMFAVLGLVGCGKILEWIRFKSDTGSQ